MEMLNLFAPNNPSPWGIWVVIYLFLSSASAGCLFVSSLFPVFRLEVSSPLTRPGAYGALLLLLLAPIPLLLELGQPGRFLYVLYPGYFNFRSPMSWGGWLLTLYGLSLLAYLWTLNGGKIWQRGSSNTVSAEDERQTAGVHWWGGLALVLALSLPLYTGIELSVVKAKAAWNTPITPLYMLTSALALGASLVGIYYIITGVIRKKEPDFRPLNVLRIILIATLLLALICLLLQKLVLLTGTVAARQAQALVFSGTAYWGGAIFLGILVPLGLLLLPKRHYSYVFCIAFLLVLFGSTLFRYLLVVKGILAAFLS